MRKTGMIILLSLIGVFAFGGAWYGLPPNGLFTEVMTTILKYTGSTFSIYNSGNVGVATGNFIAEGTIKAESGFIQTKYFRFTIPTPSILYGFDTQVCLVPALTNAITVTKIQVTLDADPTTEIAGDLKYADAFIGLATPTLINDIDTTAGVRVDTSITTGAVPAGKCLYLDFDSSPDAATTQMSVIITYTVTE